MNRSRAKVGSALVFALAASACAVPAAALASPAAATASFWFAGTRLVFDRPQVRAGALAIASDDAGLARFLAKLGATLAYGAGQKYVVLTAGDRSTVSFTIGDARYEAGGISQTATFAPYAARGAVYLPFLDVARALHVAAIDDAGATVLEPQIGALDVRTVNRTTVLTFHGASPLRFRRLSDPNDERLALVFPGTATSLERSRSIPSVAVRGVTVVTGGTARNPMTIVDFDASPGSSHALLASGSSNTLAIAFAPAGVALGGTPVPADGTRTAPVAAGATPFPVAASPGRSQVAETPAAPAPGAPAPGATSSGAAASGATSSGAAATGPPASGAPVSGAPVGASGAPISGPPPSGTSVSGGPGAAPSAIVPGVALPGASVPGPAVPGAAATPTAQGLPAAQITAFTTDESGDGLRVHLAIAGNVTYEWHRLPDDRWYVDFKPATLAMASQDVALQGAAATALRLKGFVGPTDRLLTVRVALSLSSPRAVSLVPDESGATLVVDALDDTSAQRVGVGEIAGGKLVATIVPPPTPAPAPPEAAAPAPDETPSPEPGWKFAPSPPAGGDPRLIVIDPGHGGSDTGAMHNGLVEKDLNLDLSKRLRGVLVARGWHVRLTRDADVDVFEPNDSARDELQARDDIANGAGARLFISMHTNSFTSGSLNGTTTYYFNADAYGLANAVHARLAAALPTKDDGVRKENFYVIHHTKMPAILIETAFLSNPGDAQLLKSPAFLQKIVSAIADGVTDYTGASAPLSSTMSTSDGQ